MEIILLQRIARLGQLGDVVRVKDGYARNFLLPQGKAVRASKANMARFESQRVKLEEHNLEQRQKAALLAEKLDGKSFIIIRSAGDTGHLYGSVTTRDIADLITSTQVPVTRSQVHLDAPIKFLGLHRLIIALHPEVDASVTINVARTEEEALRQRRNEENTPVQHSEHEQDQDAGDKDMSEDGMDSSQTDDAQENDIGGEADSNDENSAGVRD